LNLVVTVIWCLFHILTPVSYRITYDGILFHEWVGEVNGLA
jgi:hypothetical protein